MQAAAPLILGIRSRGSPSSSPLPRTLSRCKDNGNSGRQSEKKHAGGIILAREDCEKKQTRRTADGERDAGRDGGGKPRKDGGGEESGSKSSQPGELEAVLFSNLLTQRYPLMARPSRKLCRAFENSERAPTTSDHHRHGAVNYRARMSCCFSLGALVSMEGPSGNDSGRRVLSLELPRIPLSGRSSLGIVFLENGRFSRKRATGRLERKLRSMARGTL